MRQEGLEGDIYFLERANKQNPKEELEHSHPSCTPWKKTEQHSLFLLTSGHKRKPRTSQRAVHWQTHASILAITTIQLRSTSQAQRFNDYVT